MSTHSPSNQEALVLLEELRTRLAMVERLVAPRPKSVALPTGDVMVLIVQVRGVDVALPVGSVEEVVPYAWLTPIPEAPPWVAGVLDLGGRMICVLDVEARLRRASHLPRIGDSIVVCRIEQRRIGLAVGAIQRVQAFPASAFAPPPEDIPYASYLIGTISNAGSPLLLFSVEQLLYTSDMPEVTE